MASAYPCTECDLYKTCITVCMAPTTPENPLYAVFAEAPGELEDEEGIPLIGPSGRLLWGALKEHGIHREDAFVSNVIKCRPPGNRDPKVRELNTCQSYLDAEIDWLIYETDCKAVLAVGRFAYKMLGGTESISIANGVPYTYLGLQVVPVVHPSAVLHSPKSKDAFERGIAAFARLFHNKDDSFPKSEVTLVNG